MIRACSGASPWALLPAPPAGAGCLTAHSVAYRLAVPDSHDRVEHPLQRVTATSSPQPIDDRVRLLLICAGLFASVSTGIRTARREGSRCGLYEVIIGAIVFAIAWPLRKAPATALGADVARAGTARGRALLRVLPVLGLRRTRARPLRSPNAPASHSRPSRPPARSPRSTRSSSARWRLRRRAAARHRRELHRLGVRVSTGRATPRRPARRSSPREREVAALIVQGKANRDDAAALCRLRADDRVPPIERRRDARVERTRRTRRLHRWQPESARSRLGDDVGHRRRDPARDVDIGDGVAVRGRARSGRRRGSTQVRHSRRTTPRSPGGLLKDLCGFAALFSFAHKRARLVRATLSSRTSSAVSGGIAKPSRLTGESRCRNAVTPRGRCWSRASVRV